jgi:hypothetical protein
MNEPDPETPPHHDARTRLVWELLVFQAKLASDSIRDLILMPVAIVAVIMGLIAGGDRPDVYFRRVQRLGRRSDLWLNLFGHRHRRPSADDIARPIEEKFLAQTKPGGRLVRGVNQVNQLLDAVNRKNAGVAPRKDD